MKKATRIRKIENTVGVFGAAEKYIMFDMTFEKFFRKNFGKIPKTLNPEDVVEKYNLKGMAFGNYVTQEERFFFVYKTEKQLEVLAKVMGSNNLGKGKLVIAFGVEGIASANAHYNPSRELINLNRGRKTNFKSFMKGESSFVHEFAHFLDFNTGRPDKKINENWASAALLGRGGANTQLISEITNIVLNDAEYMEGLNKYSNSAYLQKPWEIYARLFEASITHIVHRDYPKYSAYFDRAYNKDIYYPKAKILKLKLDQKIIKSIKNFK